mgnify:FL=1|jgi:DNA-directed RNA polymerase specialized sigma24 family protein
MNMASWWLHCRNEDDKKFYRYHIVKNQQTMEWIIDKTGYYTDHEDEREEPRKEFNTDIIGVLFKDLSELDQKILRLRHAEAMKWKEISVILGYNLSYLWKREARAMKKLRAIIDRDGLSPWRKDE